MKQKSDSNKKKTNLLALGYTTLSGLLLLCLLIFVGWTTTPAPPQNIEEGVEVNLGNSEQGLGNIAPAIPGTPSASNEQETVPEAAPSKSVPEEPETSKDVAENNEANVPEIKTSPKPKEKPKTEKPKIEKKIIKPVQNTVAVHNKPKAIESPKPTPPTPKAVYKGGDNKGNGGNNADSYNRVRNQGIAGGTGDQGKINGNPNSDNYTGNGGNGRSGVSVRSGLQGRWFTSPSFEDNFNENATVAVDITVNRSGTVTGAVINPRGTTTTNANIRAIARRKALQLKFNNGQVEEQSGTIVFNFKLRG
ncbi:MAG: energy transducer TonB [Chitinophagaceae bacterium]|jgi:outer membrane biosynthesis protein TonB|nr:energy transducer TonB [Chitinophagaceae bacterium]